MPPNIEPKRVLKLCDKKAQLISATLLPVWHPKSRRVGPSKATHIPKLQKTLQYVTVACKLSIKSDFAVPMFCVCPSFKPDFADFSLPLVPGFADMVDSP